MTFDLAGIPYSEPCFANTKYRNRSTATVDIKSEQSHQFHIKKPDYSNPPWPYGLVGVVYEVTPEDYTHILATEGAGAAYQDILIDCYPLSSDATSVPAMPTNTPFTAHTLYAPVYPPGKSPPGKGTRWARPDPDYGQPSLRYLDIIRNGADEHGFPPDYKAYLNSLEPYTVTSEKQRMGAFIFLSIWQPILTAFFKFNARLADEHGKSPPWVAKLAAAIFAGVWISYDDFFYGLFGDGERTQKPGTDEEKAG